MKHTLFFFAVFFFHSCTTRVTEVIHPEPAITISAESGLTAPRDLTIDKDGNILVSDYNDYKIRKFSPSGEVLAVFGGTGGDDGFEHLMSICAQGDSILALDAGALLIFDTSGNLIGKNAFSDTITCDLPRLHPSGKWAGEWIVEETAEKVLTYRQADGQQLSPVAAFELAEFFPGIRAGEMFFINPTQLRSYLYDFLPDGQLVWAVSDRVQLRIRGDRKDTLLFAAAWQPCPYPDSLMGPMLERQAALSPPLFMNVPTHYQLIHHLAVDERGDIWVYVKSLERTGFLRLGNSGKEKGFYSVDAEFDLLSARVEAANDLLYFMLGGRDETRIYTAGRPK